MPFFWPLIALFHNVRRKLMALIKAEEEKRAVEAAPKMKLILVRRVRRVPPNASPSAFAPHKDENVIAVIPRKRYVVRTFNAENNHEREVQALHQGAAEEKSLFTLL
jgi:hypothetical protein